MSNNTGVKKIVHNFIQHGKKHHIKVNIEVMENYIIRQCSYILNWVIGRFKSFSSLFIFYKVIIFLNYKYISQFKLDEQKYDIYVNVLL
jgi:hypothetical protein